MNEQLSIFPMDVIPPEDDLHVIKCRYDSSYDTNCDELFSGFDHIKILTFSYGMSFINKMLPRFKTAEIILGSEAHAKYNILEVMANGQDEASPYFAFQGAVLRAIRRNELLINRIKNNEVSIWLAKDIIAHEKMYILTSDNGTTRVIYGSANFSKSGFDGNTQRESILVFDNDINAYNEAIEEYEMVRDFCTQEVIKDALYYSKDGKPQKEEKEIEQIPIVAESLSRQSGIILNAADCSDEDVEFAVDVSNFSKKFSDIMPKAKAGDGKIEIKSEKVNELVRKFKKQVIEEKEARKQKPQFILDINAGKASLNDKELNLRPEENLIRSDIKLLMDFFAGYDDFIGNADGARESYYMLMNYMFMTPLIGTVRSVAARHRYPMTYYPLFAVITGPKSSGKSSLVKAIQKFMFVKNIPGFSSDDWVKTTIKGLMHEVSEIPLLIDDISRERFRSNADSIIKEDEYINRAGIKTLPTFIITSNDIDTSIDPALKKRMIYLSTGLTLDDVSAAHMSKNLHDKIANITGAFYCEYLRRISIGVKDMLSLMEEEVDDGVWHPDLFKLSSDTIIGIIKKYGDVPDYMMNLSFEDYFGNNTAMRKEIRDKVLTDFEHNKSAFEVKHKKNILSYTPGEHGYEAKRVKDALPEILEARLSGNKILMKLDESERFFGIKFKKGLFW